MWTVFKQWLTKIVISVNLNDLVQLNSCASKKKKKERSKERNARGLPGGNAYER